MKKSVGSSIGISFGESNALKWFNNYIIILFFAKKYWVYQYLFQTFGREKSIGFSNIYSNTWSNTSCHKGINYTMWPYSSKTSFEVTFSFYKMSSKKFGKYDKRR